MGLDFMAQKRQAFRKMYDGARKNLAAPDLVPVEEQWEEQDVLFDVHEGCVLAEGEELVVQVSGSSLIALRGHDAVATAGNPPDSVLTAVRRARGYVLARVARFSSVRRTADLAFRLR